MTATKNTVCQSCFHPIGHVVSLVTTNLINSKLHTRDHWIIMSYILYFDYFETTEANTFRLAFHKH